VPQAKFVSPTSSGQNQSASNGNDPASGDTERDAFGTEPGAKDECTNDDLREERALPSELGSLGLKSRVFHFTT
jgi:hypothetical protein